MAGTLVRCVVVSFLVVVFGCAGGPGVPGESGKAGAGGAGVASGFPQQAAIDELIGQPLPPESALATRFRDVDEWELAGPFPEAVDSAPRAGSGALDRVVDAFVARRAGLVVATVSMDCFAREMGRFVVAEQGIPVASLQRFAAGRCGVATAPPTLASFGWSTGRRLDGDEAVAELRGEIEKKLGERALGGPLEIGAWIHSGDGRVDLVVATGERHVRVDTLPSVPGSDGRVVLSGEVLRPVEWVIAAVTRGRFEWAECEAQPGVSLPRFHLVCVVAPGDARAWISLEYRPPERLLSRPGLALLTRPQGGEERRFQRRVAAPAHVVAGAAELPAALTEVLNEVRETAGLRPLTLDVAQSQVATRVAPYYFAALFGETPESIADLVALGMMAGWDVEGTVQEALFTWGWLVESLDVSRLLADALDHPGARMTLLSRDAERIAVGSQIGVGDEVRADYLAMIASTYTLFSEATHRRDADHVHALLGNAREAQGRGAPGELEQVSPLTLSAAARVQAGEDPRDVLEDLIESGAEMLGRTVIGWMAETSDLETLVFPADFLSRDELDVAIAVPVRRPEGEAWGRYVVLMLAAEPSQRRL